jgi:conjugative relaxase-like TrwC/TraI family protein
VRLRASERDPKVAALDLTFSAPKSVSVLFAVAPREVAGELIACHEEAVGAALGYLEDEAVMVRRGSGGKHAERAEGLIAAAYRHRMSRALDPQLHTHVVVANLARGSDGRFTALHGAPLYRAAKTAGFLYQAHLRAPRRRPGRAGAGSRAKHRRRPGWPRWSDRPEQHLRRARGAAAVRGCRQTRCPG